MRLHVAADDRTGALEVAAALADRRAGGVPGVAVHVWPSTSADDIAVVDLGSRHLTSEASRSRASMLPCDGPLAHKIDSTLRGNWAAELVARHAALDRPVLLVPAFPALGRVCHGGVVMVDGRPVHEGAAGEDVRGAVESSRPADHLVAAGADAIRHLRSPDEVFEWLEQPTGFGIADVTDDAELNEIAGAWSCDERVLLAGTSAAVGAAAGPRVVVLAGSLPGPVLVVCGSVSDIARRQIVTAVEAGSALVHDGPEAGEALRAGRHAILASRRPEGSVSATEADAAAVSLAAVARDVSAAVVELGALVVIGGDTAAALLGQCDVHVLGSLTPGTAWVDSPEIRQPVITRAGAFGDERALADLLWGTLR